MKNRQLHYFIYLEPDVYFSHVVEYQIDKIVWLSWVGGGTGMQSKELNAKGLHSDIQYLASRPCRATIVRALDKLKIKYVLREGWFDQNGWPVD